MTPPSYRFVWYELMADDPAAAATFYQAVLGWNARDSGLTEIAYTILSAAQTQVGGLMELPVAARAAGARPAWIGYAGVDDVDLCSARVTAAGGSVHRPPADIPNTGRFAIVADPQGATFGLFAAPSTGAPPPPTPDTPGHGGWHELHAVEQEAAFTFYADLFGWTKGEAIAMGPMGVYQLFAAGDLALGGMLTRPPASSEPGWLFYFTVDAIQPAATRVTAAGGRVTNGPMPVPGGKWVLHATDPQGAAFALVAPES